MSVVCVLGRAMGGACRSKIFAQQDVLGLHTGDSMIVALPMYERRGFVRHPESDFEVPKGELVKGYMLSLRGE